MLVISCCHADPFFDLGYGVVSVQKDVVIIFRGYLGMPIGTGLIARWRNI